MLPFKNIVLATDFSPAAAAALPVACALARDYGARLTVVHVRAIPETITGEFGTLPMEPVESADAVRTRLRGLLPAEVQDAKLEVRDGDAATEILASAANHPDAVLVLGTHGRSGFGRLMLGGVADAVLRQAPCPVLTVRAPAPEPAETPAAARTTDEESRELTPVCSVATDVEAEVIRLALKGEGIHAFMEGTTQAGITGTLGIPVRVLVPADEFDRANRIIRKTEARKGS